MSYEPHTWVNGETITAEKMNNLEEGVSSGGGGAMIVQYNQSTGALDKTVRELNTALLSGVPVYFVLVYGNVAYQSTSDAYQGVTVLYRISGTYRYGYETSNGYYYVLAEGLEGVTSNSAGNTVPNRRTLLFRASVLDSYPTYLRSSNIKNTALD